MRFTTSNSAVVDNFEGDFIPSGIDPEGLVHTLRATSTMYSDARGPMREYASNARDAIIRAGGSDPVRIELPSMFSPVLSISDTGCGMTLHDLQHRFAFYAASDKRETNEENGGYGYGSKSGYSLASQFTVTSVRDGLRNTIVMVMSDKGPGHVVVERDMVTDQPNGTTVQIPVPDADLDTWQGWAREVFSTWARGTVLVDGVEPDSVFDNALRIDDALWWSNESFSAPFRVSLGGINYEGMLSMTRSMPERFGRMLRAHHAIIEVPIGSVDITMTREVLRDTQRTRDALVEAIESFEARLMAQHLDALDAAGDTFAERLQCHADMRNRFIDALELKAPAGYGLRDTVNFEHMFVSGHMDAHMGTKPERKVRTVSWDVDDLLRRRSSMVVLHGDVRPTARAMQLLSRWRKAHGWPTVLCVPGHEPLGGWVPLDFFEQSISTDELVQQAKTMEPLASSAAAGALYTYYTSDDAETNFLNDKATIEELAELAVERRVVLGTRSVAMRLHDRGVDDVLVVNPTGRQNVRTLAKRLKLTDVPDHGENLIAAIDAEQRRNLGEQEATVLRRAGYARYHRLPLKALCDASTGDLHQRCAEVLEAAASLTEEQEHMRQRLNITARACWEDDEDGEVLDFFVRTLTHNFSRTSVEQFARMWDATH